MKAAEICISKNLGKLFKDNYGDIWEVEGIPDQGIDLFKDKKMLSSTHTISYIANMEFEECGSEFITEGQRYFFIDSDLEICSSKYKDNPIDKRTLKYNNMYPYTKYNEEGVLKKVELIAEEKRLLAEIEKFAIDNNECEIDWNNNNQPKYYLYINYNMKTIAIESRSFVREVSTTYFTSKEVAKKAIEEFEDRIKDIYFNK